ncbi:chaperone modulator CbpM [Paraburkholderia strydomiana]|uniref:chaperone modulator CbpM n=1 Tax=Paraburkholderia strydomiana TaxID=1245417 RepID=UPI0038BB3907
MTRFKVGDHVSFSGAALRRVRTARRLAQDLEINAPGIALALDLLDENNVLRARARRPSGR